jgi:hypothetical protein
MIMAPIVTLYSTNRVFFVLCALCRHIEGNIIRKKSQSDDLDTCDICSTVYLRQRGSSSPSNLLVPSSCLASCRRHHWPIRVSRPRNPSSAMRTSLPVPDILCCAESVGRLSVSFENLLSRVAWSGRPPELIP